MIDLDLLRHFLSLARHQNLPDASEELHLTPSALSKSLKRLEQQLQTTLFDRQGRQLRLNADGQRLVDRAAALLAQAGQVEAEFLGRRGAFRCRLAGPALLQLNWGRRLAAALTRRYPGAQIAFGNEEEEEALAALGRGEADLALVTQAGAAALDPRWATVEVGRTRFEVAAGTDHPLLAGKTGPQPVPLATVLGHDFVVPARPAFRALAGGTATDGWRDDLAPRQVRYRSDDFLLVDGLVRTGAALAYLPDYVLPELGLQRIDVPDYPHRQEVTVMLVYRPLDASGWLQHAVDALRP